MGYWDSIFNRRKFEREDPDECVANLVPMLKKRKLQKILDLGCGSGRHTVYLCSKGFFVFGADVSSVALDINKNWLEDMNLSSYSLVEFDMVKIPLSDKSLDAVVCTNAIHHNRLGQIQETVDEIRRVLKDHGLVFVNVPSVKDYKFGYGEKMEEGTYEIDEGEYEVMHHFFDEKSVKRLFSKFKIIQMEEIVELIPSENIVHHFFHTHVEEHRVRSSHWDILAEKMGK